MAPTPGYRSDLYRCEDRDQLLYFLQNYPFAVLVPDACPGEFAFLPLVLEQTGDEVHLFGHVDSRNPFLRHLDGRVVHALFPGPNAYISPVDYASSQLPTWNYAIVQIAGQSCLVTGYDEKLRRMIRMVDVLEAHNESAYRLDPDDARTRPLLGAITFFTVQIATATGVFKFSQEKADADIASASSSMLRKLREKHAAVLPRLIAGFGA
jgi:transcriptional regulator